MKKYIVAIVAIISLVGSYFAFNTYEQHKFIESMRPHVKNSSLRLKNAVRYETEDKTNITFKELFEKLESDITEIDKRIIDVQTISTSSNKDITDPVLAYMNSSQSLLRALLMKYRKNLAFNNAMNWSYKAIDDMRTASYYERDYAVTATNKAVKDTEKAGDEYKESMTDVFRAAKNLKEILLKVSSNLPADALIDPTIIDAVTMKYETK